MKKHFKKLLAVTVAVAMLVTAIPLTGINLFASATEETRKLTEDFNGLRYTDEYAYGACGNYEIYIHKYIGEAGEYIEIPSEIDGYTVKYIDEKAFSPNGLYSADTNTWRIPDNESLNNLKEITIPPTVTDIRSYAFYNCKNLEKVNFSEGLEGISWGAFKGCEKITSFDFPSTLSYVYSHNFDGTSVTEVTFKKNTYYDWFQVSDHIFSGSKVVKCTVQGDGVWVCTNAFSNSVVKEVIFEGTISRWDDNVLDAKNNTVEKIVFKAGMPEGVYEYLVNDNGYFPHTASDGTFYFDKEPGNYNIFSNKGFTYAVNENNQATVFKYFGAEKDVTVPNAINGYTVVKIGDYSFANKGITSVTLPDSVEKIGAYAFYSCESLEVVNVPSKLKEINGYAFCGCKNLKAFELPEDLNYLGTYAFSRCEKIESVKIPDSITKINNGVFMDCTGLKEIEMSSNIRTIGISGFENTTSLEEIDLPDSLIIIDDRAFHSSGIKSVVFPSSLEYLMEDVFDGSGIVNAVIDGKNIEIFWAFDDCLQLETVEFKNGVKAIMNGAFYNCPSLKTVIIPEKLESIELYAFNKCENLETVYYNAINCEVDTNLTNPNYSVFEKCNPEKIIIGDKVEYLGTALFMNCDTVESIKIPDSVTKVDGYAFYSCDSLVSVEWNADRKIIGRRAFANCPKLTDFNFDNIEKSNSSCFYGSGIRNAQIGEAKNETASAVEVIATQAFMECSELSTVGIGGKVTTVEQQAFADCTNLETAVIADTVTEIAEDAFDGCDKLTIYCCEDSYAHSYAQTQGIKVSTFVIAPIPNQTFTGFEIEPEVSVTASGDTLNENIDFGVTYANNVNVGKADVNVKGKGDFRMFASRANFTIVTKSIANVSIAGIPVQDYTGNAVTPVITITDGGKILKEGTDYTVTYSNNTAEGKASIKIIGKGNYSGSKTVSFEIAQLDLADIILNEITSFFNSLRARIMAFFEQFKLIRK